MDSVLDRLKEVEETRTKGSGLRIDAVSEYVRYFVRRFYLLEITAGSNGRVWDQDALLDGPAPLPVLMESVTRAL